MSTNDFLPWAIGGGANVASQAAYAADPAVGSGFGVNAIPPAPTWNKSMRQATFVAAALTQMVMNNVGANVVDGGNVATLEAQLRSSLGSVTGVQVWTISTTSFDVFKPVNVHGATSGIITLQGQAAAGTYNWNYPITAGSSGNMLTSAGGGASAMTWTPTTGSGNVVLSAGSSISGTWTLAAGMTLNGPSAFFAGQQFFTGAKNIQAGIASGTFVNVATVPTVGTWPAGISGDGLWICRASIGTGATESIVFVVVETSTPTIIATIGNAGMTWQISGQNIQTKQSTGSPQNIVSAYTVIG